MEKEEREHFAPDVESFSGRVPVWLICVYAGLFLWGIYYLATYWKGPAAIG
ncbi:MAG: hypothetical protein M0009_08020 [Deltaproteobacteria bacterium]|nr:hypothetical protein [Deltaproteobacteria bacterium]